MSIFNFLKKQISNLSTSVSQPPEEPKKTTPRVKSESKLNYFNEEYMMLCNETPINFGEAGDYYQNNACCNCGCVIDNEIKSSKNCPSCKDKINVKTDIISKKKLFLTSSQLNDYEIYDKKAREILFMEKIMNQHQFIYNEYMDLFYSIKGSSPYIRDVMWKFVNKVGCELDNEGYKLFKLSESLKPADRVLKMFDIVNVFDRATLSYVALFEIANYKKQHDPAFSLLADIAYRDIQIVGLENEYINFHQTSMEDYISKVHSALIIEYLEKNNYTIKDFKTKFIETKHPFILSQLSNEESWQYIEKALKRQQQWNKKS